MRSGPATCVLRSTVCVPDRRRLLDQPARGHHVDALSCLLCAYVEDEPLVLGEQPLLALGQTANEPQSIDRRGKSTLQCRRYLSLGEARDKAIPNDRRRTQLRSPSRLGL